MLRARSVRRQRTRALAAATAFSAVLSINSGKQRRFCCRRRTCGSEPSPISGTYQVVEQSVDRSSW
jgi:hypothetical protein